MRLLQDASKGDQSIVIASIVAFVSTTVDDFIVIMYFFSRAETRMALAAGNDHASKVEDGFSQRSDGNSNRIQSYSMIAVGVILGFTVLVLLSLMGRIFSHLDTGVVCLLGFVPIVLGMKEVCKYIREQNKDLYDSYCNKYFGFLHPLKCVYTLCGACNCLVVMDDDDDDDDKYGDNNNDGTKGEDEDNKNKSKVKVKATTETMNKTSTTVGSSRTSYARVNQGDGMMEVDLDLDDVENPIPMAIASSSSTNKNNDIKEEEEEDDDAKSDDNDSDEEEDAEAILQEEADEESGVKTAVKLIFQYLVSPQVLEVMLIMIGVGSDNVAIYMVLFATSSIEQVILIVFIFYLLLLFNILLAAALMRYSQQVAKCFQNYAEAFVPWVLIGLGCFIVSDSVLFV
jgi:cadmium resistance protein CadD (predicted permease)